MTQCSACQHENPPEARFCNACGTPLEAPCPSCRHGNPPEAAFCNACGRPLGANPGAPGARGPTPQAYTPRHLAERILSTRAALAGERKHVTVLFCDLVGSTPLAERIGPEAMHALMDRCFQAVLGEVHRLEGTVNQFLGDGVMALFGAPLAIEDAPRRAVAAALRIQRALEPLRSDVRRSHDADFQMRIGIHSGPVVVGGIGDDLRMDYTAVGDTTNLAERLQRAALPGCILISEATEHLVSGFFELEDLGALGVKGKANPVHAFRVVAERGVTGRIEARAEAGLTPLVGRRDELGTLRRAFASAREGRGQVVFVVGEAGMGKSRLLHELRLGLQDEAHVWHQGQCSSHARNSAFHAIADTFRRAFDIGERDDDATALDRLECAERERGSALAWTLPYLRRLLSLPSGDPDVERMDAMTRRSETFRAVCASLLRNADQSPFVLVIEDLHWIDAASEELLAYLLELVPGTRMLVLLTHRPGYDHPFGDRSYHLRLTLQPLTESEMETLAGSLVDAPELPEALRQLIARKAEGNPFFVEEVTQSLLEEGALRRVEGGVELSRNLDGIKIPDRIQDVLMARLDRLEEEPKRAIQMASVIGREFALRLLERITEAGEQLRPVVEELRALELIYEKALHPELAFMFKHALTHDVAYDSVLRERRKALHRLVGTAIQELYADRLAEHYEDLAHHFTEGEDWERAFLFHDRAAEKAAAAYANQSAAEHTERALEIAERLGESVPRDSLRRIHERLGAVCFGSSDFDASGRAFRRAAELSDDAEDRAVNLVRAGYSYFWGHDYDEQERWNDEGLAFARAHRVPAAERFALLVKGFREVVFGEPDRAMRLYDEAARCPADHPEPRALEVYLRGQSAEWTGDFRSAAAHHAEGIENARKHHLPAYLIGSTWFRGKALCCLGEYTRARDCLQEGLDLAARIGDRAWRTRILNTLGWLHAELGDHEGAAEYNRRSLEASQEMLELELVIGVPELIGNASVNLAGNRIAAGDLDGAGEALEPVREELSGPGDRWMRWRYALHLRHAEARLRLARQDPEGALEFLEQEREGARGFGARKLEARALEQRGHALLLLDRRDEAGDALHASRTLAEAIAYPPLVWHCDALLAELTRRAGDAAGAREQGARALARVKALARKVPQGELRQRFGASARAWIADPLAGRG